MNNMPENITIIDDFSLESIKGILPEARYDWLMNIGDSLQRIITFAYKNDEDKVIGLCFYVVQKANPDLVSLLYVYVASGYSNQGIGTALISSSFLQLKTWGFQRIITSLKGDGDPSFLTRLDFKFLKREYYLHYSLDTLLSSKIGSNAEKLTSIRKHVKKISELSATAKKEFKRTLDANWYHANIDECDPILTRFFVGKNGSVLGYMALRIGNDGTIMNTDLFTLQEEEAAMALPAMFVDLIYEERRLVSSNAMVVLYMTSDSNVSATEQGFGVPSQKLVTDVYQLML